MKNPIRAWVAKIIREEIHAIRRERNMKAIQDEINGTHGRLKFAQEHYMFAPTTDEQKRKAGWIS